jgi:hypothetical protein
MTLEEHMLELAELFAVRSRWLLDAASRPASVEVETRHAERAVHYAAAAAALYSAVRQAGAGPASPKVSVKGSHSP